ncbi:PIN domain-containing protein [Candidatus Shapirobacteria bacterium]|nr:PIN domain-containing protein [Candidatus Shapirobacteria bacterium]
MKILVDADALVALAKGDDANHQKAVKIAAKIKKETIFLAPLAVAETATVLSYRVSQKAAILFLKEIRQRQLVELPLTIATSRLADEIFLAQKKRGISWIDCLNVAMAKQEEIGAIFSFDKFYRQFGLKLLK